MSESQLERLSMFNLLRTNTESPKGANFTSSQKKLKKMTQEIINHPTSEDLKETIRKMRMKAVGKEVIQPTVLPFEKKTKVPGMKDKQTNAYQLKYNNVTSIMESRIKRKSTLSKLQSDDSKSFNAGHRRNRDSFKEQCINRDREKHPIKYKIVAQELGINNSQMVYEMRNGEFSRIQEDYTKRKGLEYLRQGREESFRNPQKLKTEPNRDRLYSLRQGNPKSYIHQIFGALNTKKRINSEKTFKGIGKTNSNIRHLKEHEQILGRMVFQKVKTHLKKERGVNYYQKIENEEDIDDALVHFLRIKIQRAEASLGK